MRRILCIVTVCFMIIATFSGCGILQKLGFNKSNDEVQPASSIVMNEDEAKKLTDKVPIHLYFANEDSSKLKLEVRYIPVSDAKKSASSLASAIVKELISGPSASSGLKPTIPAGTQLRGPVAINTGVATVDLSKEFVDKHTGGKDAEQLTIFSIVDSLTEMKEIQKVKFLINGKVQKDFKGSFKFDADFPRSDSIISKAVAPIKPDATPTSKDLKKQDDKSKTTPPKQPETKKENTKDSTKDNKPSTTKPADTKAPANTGDNKSNQNNSAAEEDEATYLDILE